MANEEDGSFSELAEEVEDDDEYFGDVTEIVDEDRLHDADIVHPRTLGAPAPVGEARIAPAPRAETAEIGDPRLQAKP